MARFAAGHPALLAVDDGDLLRYFEDYGQRWKPKYRKKATASLTTFYRWACQERLIERDPSEVLPKVEVPKAVARPIPESDLLEAYQLLAFEYPHWKMSANLAALQCLL